MSWIADAHSQWHSAHGWDQVCPLDCGIGEGQDEYEDVESGNFPVPVDAELDAWRARQEAMDASDAPAPWEVAPF